MAYPRSSHRRPKTFISTGARAIWAEEVYGPVCHVLLCQVSLQQPHSRAMIARYAGRRFSAFSPATAEKLSKKHDRQADSLYGMAGGGGTYNGGVVFQLSPSGNGWTETVLYNLPANDYIATNPHSLLQDSAGNLFGIYQYSDFILNQFGLIFELSPSNGNWVFTELHHGDEGPFNVDLFPNMILDAAGNLLGTETASSGGCMGGYEYGDSYEYAGIFELTRANGWQYSNPVGWGYTEWEPNGSLALDAQGNLYGTDRRCGAYQQGAVWELQGIQ